MEGGELCAAHSPRRSRRYDGDGFQPSIHAGRPSPEDRLRTPGGPVFGLIERLSAYSSDLRRWRGSTEPVTNGALPAHVSHNST